MAPNKPHSYRPAPYVFVLWGDKFEEDVTTIFVTELRKAGLNVKLVGVAGLRATGSHGLILVCDMTLGEALLLAPHTIGVILPCSLASAKRIDNDPRIDELFRLARQNEALFVIQHEDVMHYLTAQALSMPASAFAIYPESADLMRFAREVANVLANAAPDA